MSVQTWFTRRFGLLQPVVGAPMAGVSGGALAGAISAAGGLGMIGVGPASTGEWIREQADTAAATGQPYGIGLMAWALPGRPDQLAAVLELAPPLVSVSFGDVTPYVAPLRDAGVTVAVQAGTVRDAVVARASGADVIVARGSEGGGHGRNAVGTLPLLQAVLDAVDIPVLAGGGVSGPRGLAAVLAAGACGAWVGTAFLACVEATNSARMRQRLVESDETATAYGRVFDVASGAGWPQEFGGRALRNAFYERWSGSEDALSSDASAIEQYRRSRELDDLDTAAVYAGQGVGALVAERSVREVMDDFAGAEQLLRAASPSGEAAPSER